MNKDIKWWKAGGPSALYLSDYVYPMLKIDKPLRSDIDEFYTFNEGAISIRDIEVTKNQLYQVGVEPIVENDAIKVFQLRRNINADVFVDVGSRCVLSLSFGF